jgi:hypothetical protein
VKCTFAAVIALLLLQPTAGAWAFCGPGNCTKVPGSGEIIHYSLSELFSIAAYWSAHSLLCSTIPAALTFIVIVKCRPKSDRTLKISICALYTLLYPIVVYDGVEDMLNKGYSDGEMIIYIFIFTLGFALIVYLFAAASGLIRRWTLSPNIYVGLCAFSLFGLLSFLQAFFYKWLVPVRSATYF